jgi:ElaB/YqjD/DUF883 family membrane-anchored ribosome-binding protein
MNQTELRPDMSATGTSTTPPVMERVVKGAHETIDRLAEHAAPHVQRVQDNVSDANAVLHERADQALELSAEWVEALRCTVRDHPVAALAAALAAGVVIARLMQAPR